MISPTYKKLSNACDALAPRFKHILLLAPDDESMSSVSLFDKNKKELLQIYKNEKHAKNTISQAIKHARDLGILQRCDDISIPEWFKSLSTVSYWQSQIRGSKMKNTSKNTVSTKSQYLYHLWNFNKWLSKKAFTINTLQGTPENTFVQKAEEKQFKNIENLFGMLEQPFADQKNITRIIKQCLLDGMHAKKKASYIAVIKSAIVSYFEKNEQPIQVLFNPKTVYCNEIDYEQSMSLSEFMEFLTTGKPSITEKAMFLCKFHRGLDVSTLVDRFNYEAWEQAVRWFGSDDHNSWDLEKCPVPIRLMRIKTGFKHVGFLDRDAIYELQRYLDYREAKTEQKMEHGKPLFVNKFGRPITVAWVFESFSRIAKRAGIQKFMEINGRRQYKMDSHELRDLLKSTLIDSGCRIDVADHVIGHMPKDSYEKQARLYPETLRKEYAKASKRLNVFTKFTSAVNGTDDSDALRAELREKLSEMERIRRRSLDDEAEKMRNDDIARQNSRQMSEMMGMIRELKRQANRSKQSKGQKMEFCCIGCSTVHDSEQCPACGSKLRRVYEDVRTV